MKTSVKEPPRLDVRLQSPELFEGSLGEDGEFLGLPGKVLPAQAARAWFIRSNCSRVWDRMASVFTLASFGTGNYDWMGSTASDACRILFRKLQPSPN